MRRPPARPLACLFASVTAEIRSRYGLTVVCLKQGNGPFTCATPDTMLRQDDVLVVAGEPRRAKDFASLD